MARVRVIRKNVEGTEVALIPKADMDAFLAKQARLAEQAQRAAAPAVVVEEAQQKTRGRSPKKKEADDTVEPAAEELPL